MPRAVAAATLALMLAAPATAPAAGQERAGLRLLDRATQLLAAGDAAAAQRDATVFVEQFAGSELIDEGLLLLARAQVASLDAAGARETAARLISEHPRTPSAADAIVMVAELDLETARAPAELRGILETVERVPLLYDADEFPRLEARAAAVTLAGETSLRLGEQQRAAGFFARAAATAAEPNWRARAYQGLGLTLLDAGDWEAAALALQQAVARPEAQGLLTLVHRHELAASGSPWASSRLATTWGRPLSRPTGIAAAYNGDLFVIDEAGKIGIRTDGAGAEIAVQNPLSEARRPWFGPDGRTYVVAQRSLLAPFARARTTFSVPDGEEMKPTEKLVAAVEGPYGRTVVAYDDGDRVARFGPDASYIDMPLGTQRVRIVDVLVDRRGSFFLLDQRDRRVFRIDAEGRAEVWLERTSWRRPEAMALDALGHLYVLDRDTRQVEMFDRDGALLRQLGPNLPGGQVLDEPRDLAVDPRGRLLIADRGQGGIVIVE